jgi:hypothetical protein
MFVGGREASWGVVIGWRFCPLRYLPIEYHTVKWVLTRRCLPPDKGMMLFRRVFRHSDVGWRRDGFPTRVLGARGVWVPTPEYMLSGMWALAFVRSQVFLPSGSCWPCLSRKWKHPRGMVGRSGPSRVGLVITLKIRLFRWVVPPLQPGVVVPLYGTGCMAPQSFAARKSRSYPHTQAVIDVPWYWGNLP